MSIKTLAPHFHFDGQADQAIGFYQRALDAKVMAVMRWSEMPDPKGIGEDERDRVMHARLQIGPATVLVADRVKGEPHAPPGNGIQMLEIDDPAELQKRFDALAEGGKVLMPVHDAFWGAKFGMLIDPFGVHWMLHCEQKQ